MSTYAAISEGELVCEKERLHSQASLWWDMEREMLRRRLLVEAEGLIIDLGCGEGTVSTAMAKEWRGWQVLGLDSDKRILRRSPLPNLSFRHISPTSRLPTADGSADAVYCRFLFQHVSEPGEVLAEIYRTLRPGGRLLLRTRRSGSTLS